MGPPANSGRFTAIRDQLDSLLDEAGRRELTIREAPTLFCEREIARKDQRRIEMSFGLARFRFSRDLAASTSRPGPRSTAAGSATWPAEASSPTVRRCCCLARLRLARPTVPLRSAAR
jgi:hypothetical protein